MAALTDAPVWHALLRHRRVMEGLPLSGLFERDPHRFSRFSIECDGLLYDFSRQRITRETADLLTRLADERGVEAARERLFAGDIVNPSERRPALHTALRGMATGSPEDAAVRDAIEGGARQRRELVDAIREGRHTGATGRAIRHVVNIGVGGSDLGPRLVAEALAPGRTGPALHFVANVDGVELADALAGVDPETTLFIVVSKSFGTRETMINARRAMDWMRERLGDDEAVLKRHFVAVTANIDRVRALGLDPALALPMWDWVGGRYSLWSAVGLSVAIGFGNDAFDALLAGAATMDGHFRQAPFAANMPVMMALLAVWNGSVHGWRSQAVVPYTERLARLPAYLQQLIMESNGKGVDLTGAPVGAPTAPAIWGQTGSVGQHAFFQALHQGTDVVPVDLIGSVAPVCKEFGDHAELTANLLAQGRALMLGRDADAVRAALSPAERERDDVEALVAARVCPGNRPSSTLLLRDLSPHRLGLLLALYEHRTFVEGVLHGINPFDQWGVELGKELAEGIRPVLEGGDAPALDASTRGLLNYFTR